MGREIIIYDKESSARQQDRIHDSYVDYLCLPETFTACLERSVELIRTLPKQPDFIACRGMSGALIAGAVAARLGVPLVALRKMDDSHDAWKGHPIGYWGKTYVIVDDFICTGRTMKIIQETLEGRECLAICTTHPEKQHRKTFDRTIPVLSIGGHYAEEIFP